MQTTTEEAVTARCKPEESFCPLQEKKMTTVFYNQSSGVTPDVYTRSPHSHCHLAVTHLTVAHTCLRDAYQRAAHLVTVHTINTNY